MSTTRRLAHRLSLAQHRWVGMLLFQARTTLLHVDVVLSNSFPKHARGPALAYRLTRGLDRVRCELDNRVYAEHARHLLPREQDGLLRIYYPGANLTPLWYAAMAYDPIRAPRERRRKWRVTWQDHLWLAEVLFQSAAMATAAWQILLAAYGATDLQNQRLEHLCACPSVFANCQRWCGEQLYDALGRGNLQWPPELRRDLYTWGQETLFTPWPARYAPAFLASEPRTAGVA